MKDRFKFRAWFVGRDSCFSEPEDWDKPKMIYNIESMYDTDEYSSFGTFLDNEEYIVMQCTGLKDKNEKLIYEGDVVLIKNCGIIYKGLIKFDTVKSGFKVSATYVNGVFTDEPIWYIPNIGKIIGNIYENPELLNKTEE